MEFRMLQPYEIEVKTKQLSQSQNGQVSGQFLLYKTARTDMEHLDAAFGNSWKCTYKTDEQKRLWCTISFFDKNTGVWIEREDCATSLDDGSNEREKTEASDAFKRAATKVGIGRELYSAPQIRINLNSNEYYVKNNKFYLNSFVKFEVANIEYDNAKKIVKLVIVDNLGNERFVFEKGKVVQMTSSGVQDSPRGGHQARPNVNNTVDITLEQKQKLEFIPKNEVQLNKYIDFLLSVEVPQNWVRNLALANQFGYVLKACNRRELEYLAGCGANACKKAAGSYVQQAAKRLIELNYMPSM